MANLVLPRMPFAHLLVEERKLEVTTEVISGVWSGGKKGTQMENVPPFPYKLHAIFYFNYHVFG